MVNHHVSPPYGRICLKLFPSIIPRKLQHTPRAHPRQSPWPTMKRIPLLPVGKGFFGVCSSSVCWRPTLESYMQIQVGQKHRFLESVSIIYHWFLLLLLMAEILHQLIGSLSHYLQGFIHPRWCRISAINSTTPQKKKTFGEKLDGWFFKYYFQTLTCIDDWIWIICSRWGCWITKWKMMTSCLISVARFTSSPHTDIYNDSFYLSNEKRSEMVVEDI